jgi:hypothetical protein
MTQVTNNSKIGLIFSKFKKINAHNLMLFVMLPFIPSVSMFLGSYVVGWHNFHRSREFLSYEASLSLSFIIYFSLISFILITSLFMAYITDKIRKDNGFLYCLNYCIYLSIPFSLLGVSALTPNIFILGLAFIAAVGLSFYQLDATVNGFLGMDADKRTHFVTLVALFFFLLVGLFLTFFLTFWPEYFDFLTSFFNKSTK